MSTLQRLKSHLRKFPPLYRFGARLKNLFMKKPIFGMTTFTEQEYFFRYGRDTYSGKGEVVDLGSWLGSTTIPLVRGCLKNPHFATKGRKIYAYDMFIWSSWMNASVAGSSLQGQYKEGDRFLDEFERRTKKFASHLEICEGDIVSLGWNGKPIEFLLIDAMKSWELANAIKAHFFKSLIPNVSVILHQDYAHYYTPWIHLMQFRLREYFSYLEEVANSTSVVFKYTSQLPEELLQKQYSFADFSDEEVDEAFDYSFSFCSREKHSHIAAAKVMTYVHQNRAAKARETAERCLERGIPSERAFKCLEAT